MAQLSQSIGLEDPAHSQYHSTPIRAVTSNPRDQSNSTVQSTVVQPREAPPMIKAASRWLRK